MKTPKLLFSLIITCALIGSCSEEDMPSSEAVNTDIPGYQVYKYGSLRLDLSFTKSNELITGFTIDNLTNVSTTFSVNGDKITGIAQTADGTTKDYLFSYDGDQLSAISGGSNDYTFEYFGDKIVQINQGTSRFYEFEYSGNNISTLTITAGARVDEYSIDYDQESNPFYGNLNLQVLTIGPRLFYISSANWAFDYLLTLTENNITAINGSNYSISNTYFRTDSSLDSVQQTSSSNDAVTSYIMSH